MAFEASWWILYFIFFFQVTSFHQISPRVPLRYQKSKGDVISRNGTPIPLQTLGAFGLMEHRIWSDWKAWVVDWGRVRIPIGIIRGAFN